MSLFALLYIYIYAKMQIVNKTFLVTMFKIKEAVIMKNTVAYTKCYLFFSTCNYCAYVCNLRISLCERFLCRQPKLYFI